MGAQVNPATLFFIEGTGQGGANAAMCWGDGFITNPCVAALTPACVCWHLRARDS